MSQDSLHAAAIEPNSPKTLAENAYLQVVQGNTAAKRLYASLGFTDFYTYWFRVQPKAVTQKGVS